MIYILSADSNLIQNDFIYQTGGSNRYCDPKGHQIYFQSKSNLITLLVFVC
jgi:hypothetical protein